MRNSRHSSASATFWLVDDTDSQSSSVQPIIDAGKQRRSSSTVDQHRSSTLQRSPSSALLFRHLHLSSLSRATMSRPPPRLFPEKTSPAVDERDHYSRKFAASLQPKRSCKDSANEKTCRSDEDGCRPMLSCSNNSGDSLSNVVAFQTTVRRSSAPSAYGLAKSQSATSLSTLDRRRPWISKYLQQFAETDDGHEKPVPRRNSKVAALINSFEQCSLQYGAVDQPRTSTGHGALHRGSFHRSLNDLDCISRRRGWANSLDKASDEDISDSATPSRCCSYSTSSQLPLQKSPPPKSYDNSAQTSKTINDHAKINQGTDTVRRSSVDVLYGSLTSLNSIGKARRWSNHSVSDNSCTPTSVCTDLTSTQAPWSSSQRRLQSFDARVKTWKTKTDYQDPHIVRRSNVDAVSPSSLSGPDNSVIFNLTSAPSSQLHHERRLSVLTGAGRIKYLDNTDNSQRSSPIAGVRAESRGIVDRDGSSSRFSELTSDGLPTAGIRYDCTISNWIKKSIPSSAVDDDGGDFEPDFWQYGGTSGRHRTGSLVSDSNNTEDSGVASSSMGDWSLSDHHEAAQDGGSRSRSGSNSGTWTTFRAGDDDDEKPNETSPSRRQLTDIPTGTKLMLIGNRYLYVL